MIDGKPKHSKRRNRPRSRVSSISLVCLIAISVVVIGIGSRIKSPLQAEAMAMPPPSTPITATVVSQVLKNNIVFRGDVSETSPLVVETPQLPSGSIPVVTDAGLRAGAEVDAGSVLCSISDRPVFALPGEIPAYRTMQQGDSGTDVRELQKDLESLGYGVGSDMPGTFGSGTAEAIGSFYSAKGFSSVGSSGQSPGSPSAGGTNGPPVSGVPSGTGISQGGPSGAPSSVDSAAVPLGEVLFVPKLPTTVVSSSISMGENLSSSPGTGGSTTAAGGTGPAQSQGSLMVLGSGSTSIQAQLDIPDSREIKIGMNAELEDDATGTKWTGTVTAIEANSASQSASNSSLPEDTISIVPSPPDALPISEVGNNLRVTVIAASTVEPVLTVPIAAVFSRANDESYVSVQAPNGKYSEVQISVGLDDNGTIQISPRAGSIKAGDTVLIGAG